MNSNCPFKTGTTAKAVLRLSDGYEVECVLIPMGRDKHTLCVSSQVGCKMGCTFCETARMGLLRHLSADEIVGQLLVARHVLGWDFKNVVFMGMGEALDNPGLFHVLRLLNDPSGMRIAQECLTVCTVGSVDGIERLADAGFPISNQMVLLRGVNDDADTVEQLNRGKLPAIFLSGTTREQRAVLDHADQRHQSALRGAQRGHRRPRGRTGWREPAAAGHPLARQRLGPQPAVTQEQQRRRESRARTDQPGDQQRPDRGVPGGQQAGHQYPEDGREAEEPGQPQRPPPFAQQPGPRVRRGRQAAGHHVDRVVGGRLGGGADGADELEENGLRQPERQRPNLVVHAVDFALLGLVAEVDVRHGILISRPWRVG